jgi:hypothetical protein
VEVHAAVFLVAGARMVAQWRTIWNLQVAHAGLKTILVAAAVVTESETCLTVQVAGLHGLTRAAMLAATTVGEAMEVMLVGTATAPEVQRGPEGVVETAIARRVHLRDDYWFPASTWIESVLRAEQVAVRVV